ncbi:hypothetical protein [Alkalihalobacillus sp. 1P02AB]|uniref:hypothetical protein n=1 Tax=Alkalihalobacillus sp. 1P02AB TaxID=3132260 RepID=UPI0039A4C10A
MKKTLFVLSLAIMMSITTACGSEENTDVEPQEENTDEVSADNVDDNEDLITEVEEEEPEVSEETSDSGWEQQVGDTVENEGGKFTLHARNDSTESIETGSMTLNLVQVNAVSGELSDEFALFFDDETELHYIQIDVEISNSSEETINFYADQATITTNTGEQLDMPDFFLSDHIGGEFIGAVNKSGSIFYILENSTADEIEWVRILISAPSDDSYETVGEEIDIKVEF